MRTSLKMQYEVEGSLNKSQRDEARKRAAAWRAAFEERQPKSGTHTSGISSAHVR